MGESDQGPTLRAILETLAGIPFDPPWTVSAIPSADAVLLADASDDASSMLIEAVASQFGEIVASECVTGAESGQEIVGLLVRPAGDLIAAAARLRGAWAIATSQGSDTEPF